MTESERGKIEQEIRDKIRKEKNAKQRIYNARWRAKNKDHIRQYNKTYWLVKKMRRG